MNFTECVNSLFIDTEVSSLFYFPWGLEAKKDRGMGFSEDLPCSSSLPNHTEETLATQAKKY